MRLALMLPALHALASAAEAPQAQGGKRPKIGLALSGGSALGLSHVGVIRWFEEHRIPIDYIAGASMGSLVGGLFATGKNAAELQQFVAEIDWDQALAPTAPYADLAFRRKEDAREYPSAFEFGLKKGISLPSGLSAGQGVGLVLSRFAAPYDGIGEFDNLPTPYRAVATDLVSGEEMVFHDGPLFDALRASMSLPALFAPVRRGKMVLVDGGAVNNIPVDVVRAMGADIVIAVALQRPPDPTRLNSLLGVAARTITVMIEANERRSLGRADLVVMPDLQGMDAIAYNKWREFQDRGYQAAAAKAKMLEQFSLSEAEYEAYQARRLARVRPGTVRPRFVEIEGNMAPRKKSALTASLAADPSKPIDRGKIEEELNKLTGMGRYDTATYTFIRRGGQEGLKVLAHEKENGPPFLKVAILLDASPQEGFRFGIGGRFTFLDFGGPASELRADLSVGQINRIGAEYYYRIKGGKWFFAPRLYYSEDNLPIYQGDKRVSDFKTRQSGGAADLGYAFGRFQELRAGYTLSHNKYAVVKGADVFHPLSGRYNDVHVQWSLDKTDSPLLPRQGFRANTRLDWILSHPGVDKQAPAAEASLLYVRPLRPKYSLLLDTAAGRASSEQALSSRYLLGGVGRLDSLGRGRLPGNRYYYGGARVLRSLNSDSLSTFGRFYFTAAVESGQAWRAGQSPLPRYSGALGLIGESHFGLVYFGAGIGDQGDHRVFFRLGRVF
ncbi:MAG: patatin-like phospholipase family protein [Candidatus Solibacter usitatus]|nr:patatin-like phospholipase family protein [Candidatus Solibacter usitatus]